MQPATLLRAASVHNVGTCAVASANDDGTGSPLGRGLGMDVSTGTTFLAELDDDGHGDDGTAVLLPPPGKAAKRALSSALDTTPAGFVSTVTLRSMRLWAAAFHPRSAAGGGDDHRLHVVHTHGSNHLIVDPFYFAPHPAARKLAHIMSSPTHDSLLPRLSLPPPHSTPGSPLLLLRLMRWRSTLA